jgi:hypothetical protein
MQNKKLLSISIIAVLTLSMLAFAAPAFAITVDPTLTPVSTGAPGTQITVSGAAGAAGSFSTVHVYWDTLATPLATGYALADGSYSIAKVTIPSATASSASNHHYIIVDDGNGVRYTEFFVTPAITASTTPKTSDASYDAKVLPGDSLTITGNGFAGSTSTTTVHVTVVLHPTAGADTAISATITTNSTGSFTATFAVPNTILAAAYGDYDVVATDDSAAANEATSPILIGYYATTTPDSGPAGITVTIAGRAPASTAYTVTISGPGVAATQIASGTTSASGAYSSHTQSRLSWQQTDYLITVNWVSAFTTADFTFPQHQP